MATLTSFPLETTPLATALQTINFALYKATSETSLAIAIGTKIFTTDENKDFAAGDFVVVSSDAGPDSDYMSGSIISYVGDTLTVDVTTIGGSGTHADWTIRLSGPPGEVGATGPTGPTGPAGANGAISISGTPTVSQLAVWTNATTQKGVSVTGLVKGNGASDPTAAVAGTDYLAPAAIGVTVQPYDAQLSSLIRQNSQSAAYTLVLTDGGKHILHPSADTTARIFTIPANSSVAFPIGTAVTFVNQNAGGVITISITTDTMRLAGAGTTGSRTLAANGVATAIKITSTEWIISGTGLT